MPDTAWVDARLEEAGRSRTGPLELFRERPWATVWRAETTDGPVWLKQPNAETVFEVGLYALLERVAPEHILIPLGVDVERGLLLLPDGGPTTDDLETALPQYAELQRAVAPHVDDLLAFGIADMRGDAMPERFEEALASIAGGGHVAAARKRYVAWCEQLAAAPGGASLDHNDLHGENILAGGRFYDWGDSVVAHPFACMLIPMGIARGDPRVRDAYLEAFTDLGPHAELVATLELACRVAKIARALVWLRAVRAMPDADPNWTSAPLEYLTSVLDDGYF